MDCVHAASNGVNFQRWTDVQARRPAANCAVDLQLSAQSVEPGWQCQPTHWRPHGFPLAAVVNMDHIKQALLLGAVRLGRVGRETGLLALMGSASWCCLC